MFRGEVITGPKGGHIATVSSVDEGYEIRPLGDPRHREFFSRDAAVQLAEGHANLLNRDRSLVHSTSLVRRF